MTSFLMVKENAVCIIETTKVEVVPFKEGF